MVLNGRTMVPLRFVAENLGCKVDWDGQTQTIIIGGETRTSSGNTLTQTPTKAQTSPTNEIELESQPIQDTLTSDSLQKTLEGKWKNSKTGEVIEFRAGKFDPDKDFNEKYKIISGKQIELTIYGYRGSMETSIVDVAVYNNAAFMELKADFVLDNVTGTYTKVDSESTDKNLVNKVLD
jgi:hypothetical protein